MSAKKQDRATRPTVEGLDSRELLSTMGGPPHAEVHILKNPKMTPPAPPILPNLGTPTVVSTTPGNGDVNPYGVAYVPGGFQGKGMLQPGDILVSNFNNGQNLQGTGTTIDLIRNGQVSTFFQGKAPLGLDTGLVVLKGGYVLVGNVPTTDGTFGTIQQGSILVLNANGQQVGTLSNPGLLNGPWDMTADDKGKTATLFVSDVESGTVSRFNLSINAKKANPVAITNEVQIASGFSHRGDPAALVLGPAGLAYDPKHDLLYVDSQADNTIHVISKAEKSRGGQGAGQVLVSDPTHLHGPMGLVLAPNGNLIVANSDGTNADPNQPSELVEYTPQGAFVAQVSIDPNNGGAFGLGVGFNQLAAVDDNGPSLKIFPI